MELAVPLDSDFPVAGGIHIESRQQMTKKKVLTTVVHVLNIVLTCDHLPASLLHQLWSLSGLNLSVPSKCWLGTSMMHR
jgi:hypothetical protein